MSRSAASVFSVVILLLSMLAADKSRAEDATARHLRFLTFQNLRDLITETGLVNSASDDLIVAVQGPWAGNGPSEPDKISFYTRRADAPPGHHYQIVKMDPELRKSELYSGYYTKEFVSDEYFVVSFGKGDCVVDEPFIYPAQESLKRGTLIIAENSFPNFALPDFRSLPKTRLLKLELTADPAQTGQYSFRIVGSRTLDQYYCSPQDLLPFVNQFVSR